MRGYNSLDVLNRSETISELKFLMIGCVWKRENEILCVERTRHSLVRLSESKEEEFRKLLLLTIEYCCVIPRSTLVNNSSKKREAFAEKIKVYIFILIFCIFIFSGD